MREYLTAAKKEYLANGTAEGLVQPMRAAFPQLRRRCSPPSPAPLIVSEAVEHPAGISRRLKTREVLMKALIFRETGEPKSVLKLAEIPTPPLAPGEALVRVLLSPINASDLHMVRGRYGYQPELPASPGIEGVGIVEAVDPGVQGPMVGTRVVFVDTWNTWREQIVCPADKLVPVPDGVDDSAAAASYINPLTAWALTISTHNLKEGDWLLQTAAASSVGKFVLQLAQQYRFKTINVIRRREQETIIRNLGGDEVICTADEDLRVRLQELTGGKGVERAIDCVAGDLGAEIVRNLAPAGTMLVYGALSSHRQTDPAKFTMPLFAPRLIYSTATIRGWWLPRWVSSQPLAEVRAATSDLLKMLSKFIRPRKGGSCRSSAGSGRQGCAGHPGVQLRSAVSCCNAPLFRERHVRRPPDG
jgi:NADPH:quinone reductase-like Zn-dependent oxidoreductase